MAKNEKNVKNTEDVKNTVELTADNIEEQIKSSNKMEDSIVSAAKEQIKKEADERKQATMKTAILEATYINNRELLELRKRRKEATATKEALTETKNALDELSSGKITPREYEKKVDEVRKKKSTAFNEIEKNHNELVRELRDNFPNNYSFEWEYDRWSENRVSRYEY